MVKTRLVFGMRRSDRRPVPKDRLAALLLLLRGGAFTATLLLLGGLRLLRLGHLLAPNTLAHDTLRAAELANRQPTACKGNPAVEWQARDAFAANYVAPMGGASDIQAQSGEIAKI
ncbi:hypothetical protein [Gemmobacter caeruleus]|uniref:hypothetical protein n=1 Tax=Gemmobacter caeruleus TaxID=2595004 RepID=UPI001396AB84|nr:hypothetical protein [Gemmobacter caeruleus]